MHSFNFLSTFFMVSFLQATVAIGADTPPTPPAPPAVTTPAAPGITAPDAAAKPAVPVGDVKAADIKATAPIQPSAISLTLSEKLFLSMGINY